MAAATAEPTPLELFTEDHLKRLQGIYQRGSQEAGPRQRGAAVQQTLRELERSIRQGVLDFCQQAIAQRVTRQALAAQLTLSERTLRHWAKTWRNGGLPVCLRGRPLCCSEPEEQQAVIHRLHQSSLRHGNPHSLLHDYRAIMR